MSVITVLMIFLIICMVYEWNYCDAQTYLPFGLSESDTKTPVEDSGFARIDLTENFKFYGNLYSKLYINEDGIISFNSELVVTEIQNNLPLADGKTIICVLCADVAITNGGEVWYGIRSDATTLNKVGNDVKTYFPNFNPSWVFVGTWNNVKSFANDESEEMGNVFQVVLASDSGISIVIFDYKNITWVSDNKNDYPDDPVVIRAKSGFNAGDGVSFFIHPDSETEEMVNIDEDSNYNEPGMFMYKVDTTIEQPSLAVSSTSAISADPTTPTTTTVTVSTSPSSHINTVSQNDLTTSSSPVSLTSSLVSSTSSQVLSSSFLMSSTSFPVSSTSSPVSSTSSQLSSTLSPVFSTSSLISSTSSPEQGGLPEHLIAIYASVGSACGLLIIAGVVYFCYSQMKPKPVPKPTKIQLVNNSLSSGSRDDKICKEPFRIPRPKLSHNKIHVV